MYERTVSHEYITKHGSYADNFVVSCAVDVKESRQCGESR